MCNFLWTGDAHEHEGDAEFDGDDGYAEEDFEEEEPLLMGEVSDGWWEE